MSEAKGHGVGEEGGGGSNPFVDAIFWLLLFLVLYSVISGGLKAIGVTFDSFPSLSQVFASIFDTIQVFSVFLSLLFFIGIIYFNHLLGALMHHSHGHGDHGHGHDAHHGDGAHGNVAQHHAKDSRWQTIQKHIDSHNEADWRLAIIESDILLDDMLSRMGYHGESIGEKLKSVEKSDFATIDEAWEAHKIRNRIAHDGTSFKLTREDATRTVNLYKKVFEEFYFI